MYKWINKIGWNWAVLPNSANIKKVVIACACVCLCVHRRLEDEEGALGNRMLARAFYQVRKVAAPSDNSLYLTSSLFKICSELNFLCFATIFLKRASSHCWSTSIIEDLPDLPWTLSFTDAIFWAIILNWLFIRDWSAGRAESAALIVDMVGAGDEDEVVNDSSPPFPEVGAGETPLLSTEGKAFSRPRFFVFGVICDSIFIASTLLLLSFVMLMIGTTVVVLRKEGRLAKV